MIFNKKQPIYSCNKCKVLMGEPWKVIIYDRCSCLWNKDYHKKWEKDEGYCTMRFIMYCKGCAPYYDEIKGPYQYTLRV